MSACSWGSWGWFAPSLRSLALLTSLLVASALLGPSLAPPAAKAAAPVVAAPVSPPQPVIWARGYADPAPVRRPDRGYTLAATGLSAPRAGATSVRGPWREQTPALTRIPSWATRDEVWGPDLVKVGSRWLLYFSLPVAGPSPRSRCIGVAASRTPTGPFTPQGDRPLVCPEGPASGADLMLDPELPMIGAIDPSLFVNGAGQRWLLYRTQGVPSSIRVIRLRSGGATVLPGQVSRRLVLSEGTIENPVLVQRGRSFVLFTSEGLFQTCDYRTTWRRSSTMSSWEGSEPQVLTAMGETGLCGPGGADVAATPTDPAGLLFVNGWVCGLGPRPCAADFNKDDPDAGPSWRAVYVARLEWVSGRPRVRGWVRPAA